MWVSKDIVNWFSGLHKAAEVNAEAAQAAIRDLREELSATRSERDAIKVQLSIAQNHFDWLKSRVNTLEVERAELLKRAYNIDTVVPEILKKRPNSIQDFSPDLFNDMGDDEAKKLGLPVYSS